MLSEYETKAIKYLSQFEGNYVKTILNLITKLQKENKDIQIRKNNQEKRFKKYKKNIDKQHEEIYENLVSEKEKYKYLYQKALDNTITADKENIQLKKQIDLMADTLQDNLYLTPLDGLNKKEIKLYFEKLAKEKGE